MSLVIGLYWVDEGGAVKFRVKKLVFGAVQVHSFGRLEGLLSNLLSIEYLNVGGWLRKNNLIESINIV